MPEYSPDAATARADLCRFLAACFYEPTTMFAEEKLFDSLRIAAVRVHSDLEVPAQRLMDAFFKQDLGGLLVDYTRLFLGPVKALALPYRSSWISVPTPTDDNPPPAVLDLYSEGGFEVDEQFMELPDHVAVELEFLYLLNFNINQAAMALQAAQGAATLALKQKFLNQHLGQWITPFASAVRAGAETAFYLELADITERFVHMEAAG